MRASKRRFFYAVFQNFEKNQKISAVKSSKLRFVQKNVGFAQNTVTITRNMLKQICIKAVRKAAVTKPNGDEIVDNAESERSQNAAPAGAVCYCNSKHIMLYLKI